MNTSAMDHFEDRLERATAARLARLRTMPVDTSGLEARLREALPVPPALSLQSRLPWLGALRAAAAGFVVVATLWAVVIGFAARPVMASADMLARLHDELASGRTPAVKASSVEAAAAAIAEQWPKAPSLPAMPDERVMACCVHAVGRKKMALVALELDGTPVTMAIANQADMKSARGRAMVHEGVTYQVQSSGGVNMAMTERGGRWVCLMGRLPAERLIDAAARLQF